MRSIVISRDKVETAESWPENEKPPRELSASVSGDGRDYQFAMAKLLQDVRT